MALNIAKVFDHASNKVKKNNSVLDLYGSGTKENKKASFSCILYSMIDHTINPVRKTKDMTHVKISRSLYMSCWPVNSEIS